MVPAVDVDDNIGTAFDYSVSARNVSVIKYINIGICFNSGLFKRFFSVFFFSGFS